MFVFPSQEQKPKWFLIQSKGFFDGKVFSGFPHKISISLGKLKLGERIIIYFSVVCFLWGIFKGSGWTNKSNFSSLRRVKSRSVF